MKDRESILNSRWLKPVAHRFRHPSLWRLNRRSVPRAVAIGLFVGFLIPLGQFVAAALLALPLRANVPLSAAATLVTNPLTFPPIYFAAYKLGALISRPWVDIDAQAATGLLADLLNVSGQTALGLLVLAVVSSASAFAIAALFWRIRLVRRWRRR